MNKAYKFRIYPNEEQRMMLAKTFGCVRKVWNLMLADRISEYERARDAAQKMKYPTPAQYKEEHPFLKEVDSLALANAQLNLDKAYKNFFRDKEVGFPNWKSRKNPVKSYTTNVVNGNITLENNQLKLPKIGKVRVKAHRSIPEDYQLKSVTVSQSPSGKYYASIVYEYNHQVQGCRVDLAVGLDFSMSELYISSEGNKPQFPRFYRRAQDKLARMQRVLSKMQRGSNNYNKQKLKIASYHQYIANCRKDFLHKESRQITNAFDLVAIENLNMKAMSRSLNFGKSVSDNGWGMFVNFLSYKLAENGKYLIKVDKWFPSSKICSVCGVKKEELFLSERIYICDCGNVLDRDVNAAINIRDEGIRMLTPA